MTFGQNAPPSGKLPDEITSFIHKRQIKSIRYILALLLLFILLLLNRVRKILWQNSETREGGKVLKILLADDDKNFGIVLKNELEEEKYTVNLVYDGVEAVLSFMNNLYDFVLLDIKLPKLDGINTLRIIKKINPTVPAITFSGHAGNVEMAESIEAGAIKCLTKPFEIAEIREEVKRYNSRP